MVPQSSDEYGDGVISRPSYIVAQFAGLLSRVPFIGPYAMATSMQATRIGDAAKYFGFTKPAIVSNTVFNKIRHFPALASAAAHDPIHKSTFDDKAEVTIDPRVVGADGKDEMTIASIASRESYLTQFNMGQAVVPGTRLFQILVSPTLAQRTGAAGAVTYAQTPMCWVAQPFNYWRGSIRYRFRVVSSTFHRGRIRIVYDPSALTANLGSAVMADHNIQHTYVWDLAQEKEAVIDVGWNVPFPYLDVAPVTNISPFYTNDPSPTGNLPYTTASHNGTLSLIVMNELTAPNPNLSSPVTILVSVSALDDFEVFDPIVSGLNQLRYVPQSGEVIADSKFYPVALGNHDTFGNSVHKAGPAIHHGDPIVTLRTILKRYMYSVTHALPASGGGIRISSPTFPLHPGKVSGAVHLAGAVPYNYSQMTHLNYFSPAYLARRGGIRVRLSPLSPNQCNSIIARTQTNTFAMSALPVEGATPSLIAREATLNRCLTTSGWSGASAAYRDEPLDLELPFHTRYRYSAARTTAPAGLRIINSGWVVVSRLAQIVAGQLMGFDVYVSAADDFSLSVFVAVPLMYDPGVIP